MFQHIVLHNCGATGANGPQQDDCLGAYANLPQKNAVRGGTLSVPLFPSLVAYFPPLLPIQFLKDNFVADGIQTVTIPTDGFWRITAYGARGGYGKPSNGTCNR